MTKVYTVHGSEDGVIAIATSPAKAVAIAKAYVTVNGGQAMEDDDAGLDMNKAMSLLRKRSCNFMSFYTHGSDWRLTADITKFDTNWSMGRDW